MPTSRFLQATLDALSSHIAILDENGAILAVNKAWRDFGAANALADEASGIGINYLEVCGAEDSEVVRGIRDVMQGTREAFYTEYPCHGPQDRRWFSMRVTRFEEEGRTRVVVAHDDISQRKTAEEAHEEEADVVETVNRIGHMMGAELNVEKLVRDVTDAATELTGAQFGAFFHSVLNDHNEQYLLSALAGEVRDEDRDFPIPRDTLLFQAPFISKSAVRLDDVTQDPRYGSEEVAAIRSYMAVPVISRDGEVLGGLFFGHSKAGIFSERAERLAVGLASQTGVAIDNARLFEALRRERAQARAGENQYRLLAETLPHMVWTTRPDGFHAYYNARWYEYTGLTPEQSRGEDWQLTLHPDDRQRAAMAWNHSLRTGEAFEIEYRFKRASDGMYRWQLGLAMPLRDDGGRIVQWFGTCTDIHDRRVAEESAQFLAEATQVLATSLEYETTLQSLADLCVPRVADWCAIDVPCEGPPGSSEQLAVAHIDPAKVAWAREMRVNYPPLVEAHTGVPQVLRTGQAEIYTEIPDLALQTAARDPEHLRLLREVGFSSAMIVPMIAGGHTLGALTLVSSDSKRRYSAEDLALAEELARRAALFVDNARLFRETEAARQEAVQASRAKDEFLAVVSHELRTPLTPMLGWIHLLRSGTLADAQGNIDAATQDQALEAIERNAKAQAQLVNDLLDVSRIVTGKLRLDVRPLEPGRVVEAAIEAIRPAADARGIRLQSILTDGGKVSGDPDRLQQIVWNLLTNAIKFTPRDGSVMVRLQRVASSIEIAVSDSGIGIEAEFLPHVFERFRQADGSSTRVHGGLGLGLSIVRHLTELHGGTITAESPGLNQGTTFRLKLPLLSVEGEPDEPVERRTSPAPSQEMPLQLPDDGEGFARDLLGDLRVLIIEDESDARELIATVLQQYGAQVETASSVQAGLDCLNASFDLLISDIGMPGEDGYSLIRRVRSLPEEAGGRVPAVALTAYARAEDRIRALSAGFQNHLAKPVSPTELVITVASLVGRIGAQF